MLLSVDVLRLPINIEDMRDRGLGLLGDPEVHWLGVGEDGNCRSFTFKKKCTRSSLGGMGEVGAQAIY